MTVLGYIIYRSFTAVLSRIPFPLLYVLSDGVAVFLYSILRYRRSLVITQLKKSFPSWKDAEIRKVAWESYKNLSDILLESFKTGYLSEQEMARRYHVRNPELIESLCNGGQGIIGVGAHFNNWEWGSVALSRALTPKIIGLYKPLANKMINRSITKIREDANTWMVPIKETRLLFDKSPEEDTLYVFVADQSPSNMRDAIWLDFLNQDTACLHGPEKYHHQTNYPVVFIHIYRQKRGFYEIEFSRIKSTDGQGITETFMKVLEKDIRQSPASWLWTHKRWKRRREEAKEQAQKLKERREQTIDQ